MKVSEQICILPRCRSCLDGLEKPFGQAVKRICVRKVNQSAFYILDSLNHVVCVIARIQKRGHALVRPFKIGPFVPQCFAPVPPPTKNRFHFLRQLFHMAKVVR